MKKSKKILGKVKYEENPWGTGDIRTKKIDDFLPSPAKMKNLPVQYIDDNGDVSLSLAEKDKKALSQQAKKAGLSPEAFIIGVMHDFLTGKLIRPNR